MGANWNSNFVGAALDSAAVSSNDGQLLLQEGGRQRESGGREGGGREAEKKDQKSLRLH